MAQPTTDQPTPTKSGLSTFDAIAIAVVVLLVGGIGATLLSGDRVGVQLTDYTPQDSGGSTAPITMTFSTSMNRATVEDNFQTDPPTTGFFSWDDDSTTLTYHMNTPLTIGSDLTVTLLAGAESQAGREVLEDKTFSYTITPPRALYLGPADASPQNIFALDISGASDPIQLTDSETGIFDFAASPDGQSIAFAEYEPNLRDINLRLLDVASGTVQTLTACQNATCTSPVWRPDGNVIAYTRVDGGQSFGTAQTRIWTVDITGDSFDNEPLFDDNQMIGYAPQWSADGLTIAFYDPSAPGILVYDILTQGIQFVPNPSGRMGALSADANTLVYADFTRDPSQSSVSFLEITDLAAGETTTLTQPDDGIDDSLVIWHPNDGTLTVGRRYTDEERFTQGLQIFSITTDTSEATPLVYDEQYAHAVFAWDPTGRFLIIQRFQLFEADGSRTSNSTTEVWVYDAQEDTLTQLATNAFLPAWLP